MQVINNLANPADKVQLFLSCRNLVNLDILSLSDPIIHVYMKPNRTAAYSLLGKTEMILNNLNPDFTKSFIIDYFFEKEQWLKFEVYDVDNTCLEHIGTAETTLARIMTASSQTWLSDLTLQNSKSSRGKLIVRADSVSQSNDEVCFKLSAVITQAMGGWCCGADNPYVVI